MKISLLLLLLSIQSFGQVWTGVSIRHKSFYIEQQTRISEKYYAEIGYVTKIKGVGIRGIYRYDTDKVHRFAIDITKKWKFLKARFRAQNEFPIVQTRYRLTVFKRFKRFSPYLEHEYFLNMNELKTERLRWTGGIDYHLDRIMFKWLYRWQGEHITALMIYLTI